MRANDHDGGDRLIRRRQVLFETSVLLERQPLQVSPMSAMATRLFRQLGAISSGVERNGLTRGGTIHATRVHRHRIGHFMRRKRDRIVLNAAIITNYHLSIVRGPATIAGGWSCGDLGPEDKLRVLAGLESQIFSTYEVAIDHGSPIGQDASALRQVGQVRAVDRHPVPDAGLGDIQYRLGRQGVGLGSGSAFESSASASRSLSAMGRSSWPRRARPASVIVHIVARRSVSHGHRVTSFIRSRPSMRRVIPGVRSIRRRRISMIGSGSPAPRRIRRVLNCGNVSPAALTTAAARTRIRSAAQSASTLASDDGVCGRRGMMRSRGQRQNSLRANYLTVGASVG